MLEQDPNQPIRAAKREDMSGWIIQVVAAIDKQVIKNAWCKMGYSYYE